MEKKRTVQRTKSKKKNRPKLRFNFAMLIVIFAVSFVACFILYMIAANINPSFMEDEFGDKPTDPSVSDTIQTTSEPAADGEEPTEENLSGMANPVPESEKADVSYFESACLITDSTLMEMDANGKFSKANIFGSEELTTSNCNIFKVDSSFGKDNVYEIVKSKKPSVLYIMLGNDIDITPQDSMISSYTTLVTNLHAALPDMKIYVMQYPPVIADTDTLTNEMVNSYNKKLLAMCNAAGVYCIDTNTALKGENGALVEKYWSADGNKLSADAYKAISDYISNHVA